MTLTKADLVETLAAGIGMNRRKAGGMVDAFFEVICSALERGNPVKLPGFGRFAVRAKRRRPGRNSKTLEMIPVSARRVVTFHASQKLKGLAGRSRGDGRN